MPDVSQNDEPAVDGSPLPPAGVRALYIAVVVMGIMIVAGVALVVGRIFYLASLTKPAATAPSTGQPVAQHSVSLPAGATIEETSLAGNRLLVRYRAGGNSAVLIYDIATGRTVSRIDFK